MTILRGILIISWSLASLVTANAAERLADVPRLKASVRVASDVVRIGDLIENAGPAADVAIFRSPDIGSTGNISAAKILDTVGHHNLLIVDATGIRDVEITRVSRTITVRDIESRIARALTGQPGLADASRLTVTFDRDPRAIHVEPEVTGDLQVVRSAYEPRTARFDVTFNLPGSNAARTAPLRYVGYIRETVEVPLLTRSINRGEIIRDADVMIERRARADVSADALTSQETVIGLAARQPLRAGVPLRRTDLARPEVIKRDETVTIFYEVPGITLTIRGKALENGAEGDLINVLNTQSKRTVQGVVTGPGRVSIVPAAPVQILNTAAITPAANGQGE